MPTQSTKIQELDKRLRKVEKQIAELVRTMKRRRERTPQAASPQKPARPRAITKARDESAMVDEILRQAGLLHEPTQINHMDLEQPPSH